MPKSPLRLDHRAPRGDLAILFRPELSSLPPWRLALHGGELDAPPQSEGRRAALWKGLAGT